MPGFLAAAAPFAPAFASLIGSLATSAFNVHESRSNRRFMRDQANTEIQRRKADLLKAGMNPMLAVGGGHASGASTPTTSAAQVQSPHIDPMSVLQAKAMQAGILETNARTAKELADAGKIGAERQFLDDTMEDRVSMEFVRTQHELRRKDLTEAERDMLEAKMVMLEREFEKLGQDIEHSALDMDRMRAESAMYRTLGGFGAAGKAGLLRIPGGALRLAKSAKLLGSQGVRHSGKFMRNARKHIKRVNTRTGEILD